MAFFHFISGMISATMRYFRLRKGAPVLQAGSSFRHCLEVLQCRSDWSGLPRFFSEIISVVWFASSQAFMIFFVALLHTFSDSYPRFTVWKERFYISGTKGFARNNSGFVFWLFFRVYMTNGFASLKKLTSYSKRPTIMSVTDPLYGFSLFQKMP